jgi:hypothetical protein
MQVLPGFLFRGGYSLENKPLRRQSRLKNHLLNELPARTTCSMNYRVSGFQHAGKILAFHAATEDVNGFRL